jgi:hypothetical protein
MIQSLKSGEIDVGIGLTEAWVAGLSSGFQDGGKLPYKIIGSYVSSPLCWAISAGSDSSIKNVDQLRGSKIGVSRIGSGSYVMSFVLADQKGWMDFGRSSGGDKSEPKQQESESHGEEISHDQLAGGKVGTKEVGGEEYLAPAAHVPKGEHVADMGAHRSGSDGIESSSKPSFEFVTLQTFEKLRAGVNDGTVDAFMWEHFTSKKYYDNGEIRRIGEIYTPWASWKIVARDSSDKSLPSLLESISQGISMFQEKQDEAVEFISTNLDYSADDARAWLKTVKFSDDITDPVEEDLKKAYNILMKAGVIDGSTAVEDLSIRVS